MTATLLDRLAERLRSAPVAITATTPIAVALSGGVDSVVLLSAVHEIGAYRHLRGIHVDHQLHPDAAEWSQFCRALATRLGIEYCCRRVQCAHQGNGVEAAARAARYAAFSSELRDGEVLLTAHHGDDQLETQLYRMLRGTGVDGLRGIREFESFGRGFLMRPLLGETRADIVAQAQAWNLRWLEDPSNADTRFDRNFLRRTVLPELLARWPRAGRAASRLGASADDSAELAEALARADLAATDNLDVLPLDRLSERSPARRRNVLRYVLRQLALPVPDAAALERICALADPGSGQTVVSWPGGEAHRHRGALYLHAARPQVPLDGPQLSPDQPYALAHGRLELERGHAPALPEAWVRSGLSVRFRAGGERFRPAGTAQSQPLREWMRASAVVPWMRDRIPLLYRGAELVAVADLGVSADAAAAVGAAQGWRVVWHDRPRTAEHGA